MISALLLALLLAAPAWADDSSAAMPSKALKRRVATSSKSLRVPAADPTPVCKWTPLVPDPCECYYERPADGGPRWAWKECPAPEPVALLEPVFIPEPLPDPEPLPTPAPPPEPGMRLTLEAWSLAGFSGAADREITTGGRLSVDGPVANTWGAPLRMFLRLDVSALPGQSINFASVDTFGRSAEVRGGVYRRLAQSRPVDQHITTSLVAYGGFATVSSDEVLDRYLRSVGVGIRLAEEINGAEVTVGYCRDEAAGYIGTGQVCIGGSVPIVGTKGALVLGGAATLNLSRATVSPQRDVFRLWLGASVGDLVSAVRGR